MIFQFFETMPSESSMIFSTTKDVRRHAPVPRPLLKMAGLFADRCTSLGADHDNSLESTTFNKNEGRKRIGDDTGGWTFEFIDLIDKEFECNVCLLPMKDPFMTRCGHNICEMCLEKLFDSNAFCPEDRTPITREDVFPDMKCHRKIMSLRVKCPYAEMDPYSCNWNGELNDLMKKHLEGCESEQVVCIRDSCKEKLTREGFKQHIDHQCLWRDTTCYYCGESIVFCKYQRHQSTDCPEVTVPCPNICSEQMSRRLVSSHLQNDCPNRLVECPFTDGGCNEKVAAKDLGKHVNESVGNHLIVLYNKTKDQGQKIEQLKEEVQILKEQNKEMTQARDHQAKLIKDLEERLSRSTSVSSLLYSQYKLSDISTLLSFVSKNENQQVFNNLIDFLKEESMLDCHVMENAWSYLKDDEIVLIWFIKDFRSRQQKQRKNYTADIESPYFSTPEKGYVLRFDPYGCLESRGTHVSCCLYTEKGKCDREVKFPHIQQFRITVINSKDRQKDVSAEKTFEVPKPPNYFNCESPYRHDSYIHKILSLENVEKFLLNDTLILKISVNHYNL